MSAVSMTCLAGLDAIHTLQLSNDSHSSTSSTTPHQLPLFSTFLGTFTSSPYLFLSSSGPAVSTENMSKPRTKPSLHFRERKQPQQQQVTVRSPPLETLPPLPSIPAISLPHFSLFNETPMTPRTIPKLHHPNSPYVPWSQPTRREIITPNNSSSMDHCYSRSGAQAPEPPATGPLKAKLGKLCKRVKVIASHLLPKGKGTTLLVHHSQFKSESELYSPTPRRSTFFDPTLSHSSRSSGSTESFESTSLEVWLAARIQQNDAPSEKGGMTLEEYEKRGSWLRVPSKRSLVTTLTSATQRSHAHTPSPLSTCATVSHGCAENGHDH